MRKSIIEKLDAIPMPELFKYYNVDWVEGRNFKCPFPNHGATGNTPSGRYYPSTNSFSCFGCHHGGGPVHFVMNMENISYIQACDKLMSMFNIEKIPEFSYQKLADRNQKKGEVRDERLKYGVLSDVLSKVSSDEDMKKFSLLYLMVNSVDGAGFLQQSIDAISSPLSDFILRVPQFVKDNQVKGVNVIKSFVRHDFEVVREFDPIPLHSGYFSEDTGILWSTQDKRYVFPIFLPGKVIAGFSGRTLNPNETLKYQTELLSQLTKKDLVYGLDVAFPYIREMGYVVIVEGILDAVRCWSVGFKNVVAPCCAYVSDNIAILLKGVTENFLLFQDGDFGGDEEASMSESALKRHGLKFRRMRVPEGDDPDSYGRKNPIGLAELLKVDFN